MQNTSSKKILIIIVVIVIAAIAAFAAMQWGAPAYSPEPQAGGVPSGTQAPLASEEQELQSIPLDDLGTEIQDIDKELAQ